MQFYALVNPSYSRLKILIMRDSNIFVLLLKMEFWSQTKLLIVKKFDM